MKNFAKYSSFLVLVGVLAFGTAFSFKYAIGNSYAADTNTCEVLRDGKATYVAVGQRLRTCQRMNEMATVPWTIDKKIEEYEYAEGRTAALDAGNYQGIPYTQKNRDNSMPSKVQENMTAAANGEGEVKGVDCSAAVSYALRYGTGNNASGSDFLRGTNSAYGSAQFLFDGMRDGEGSDTSITGSTVSYRDDLTKVGYYGRYSGYSTDKTTEDIVGGLYASSNYEYGTIYDNVYAKIRPGDALLKVAKDGRGHVMIVTRVELAYYLQSSGGMLRPSKSRVCITEQKKPNQVIASEEVKGTSWNVNTYMTFNELVEQRYLPVTVPSWDSDTVTIEYDAAGGQFSTSSQEKERYRPLKIPTDKPVKEGYLFVGWKNTNAPFIHIYQPGDYYMEESGETLVAVWVREQYTGATKPASPGSAEGASGSGKDTSPVSTKNMASKSVKDTPPVSVKGTRVKSIKSLKKGFRVKWKGRTHKVTGYQIRYSTKPTMKGARKSTIAGSTTLQKTVRKLKAGRKYFVQVRVYKKVAGVKYYSAWSKKVCVRTH